MKIWVDADACPRDAKDVVMRAANRLKIKTTLVANQSMRFPKSAWVDLVVVPSGSDRADDFIAAHVLPGDVVIVEDIPLAARIVDAGAIGIDPRGSVFHQENVKHKLAARNLLADLRDAGMVGGGPAPYRPRDKSKFASALDRMLTKLLKEAASRA